MLRTVTHLFTSKQGSFHDTHSPDPLRRCHRLHLGAQLCASAPPLCRCRAFSVSALGSRSGRDTGGLATGGAPDGRHSLGCGLRRRCGTGRQEWVPGATEARSTPETARSLTILLYG